MKNLCAGLFLAACLFGLGIAQAEEGGEHRAQMLQRVTDEIKNLQQRLADPNTPDTVITASQKLLADLNTLKDALTNEKPDKEAIKNALEEVKAERQAMREAMQANGGGDAGARNAPGGGGQGGKGGHPLLQMVNNQIEAVQKRLADANTPPAVSAALQKLLTDLNTLKTDLTTVNADRQAVRAAEQASGEGRGQGQNKENAPAPQEKDKPEDAPPEKDN